MKLKIVILLIFFISFCYSQDKAKWYQKPLRISALQCNFEKDTYQVIDYWSDMGFNTEQLFHPIADSYSAIYDALKHKEILKKYIKKAHDKDIRIILYLNVHILGPSLDDKKDVWSQKNDKGEIKKLYGTYPSICLNSSWKSYFLSLLDDLKGLDIDGIFLDGPVITKPTCYCDSCKAKYQREFNAVLGTDSIKTWEFNAETRDDFLGYAYSYWKKSNPDKLFYFNLPLLHPYRSFVNIKKALEYNDIIGTEGGFMFYTPANQSFLYRTSFTAKLLEAAAPDKPKVIFMAADNKPWNWVLHTPGETELCIAASISNGSNIWYGLHGSTELLKSESAKKAKDILLFEKKNEKYFDNTKPFSRVALFYSFTNSLISGHAKDPSDFSIKDPSKLIYGDTEDAMRGWYSMLTECQIPFDIITDLDLSSVNKYSVVICPNAVAVDEKSLAALRNYVKSGGRMISECSFSLFDSIGTKKDNYGLSDVFGIKKIVGMQNHEPFNYFLFDSTFMIFDNVHFPLPSITWSVDCDIKAEIMAKALDDLKGRYVPLTLPKTPFLIHNKYGNGDSYYFSGNFGEMFNRYYISIYKDIVSRIITEKLTERIIFSNCPVALEVIERKSTDDILLHLINYNGGPLRPMEKITPANNIRLKLPPAMSDKKVKSLKSGHFLTKEGEWFVLPELNVYDILIVK